MILRHYRVFESQRDGRIPRTMEQPAHDYNMRTLRAARTLREAGMSGPPVDDDGPSLHSFPAMLLWGCIGALVLWVFVTLVFSL